MEQQRKPLSAQTEIGEGEPKPSLSQNETYSACGLDFVEAGVETVAVARLHTELLIDEQRCAVSVNVATRNAIENRAVLVPEQSWTGVSFMSP